MDPFKTQRLLEADPSRFSRRDKAKIPYKENTLLKDCLRPNSLKLARKPIGDRVSKIDRQGSGADGTSIVELYPIQLAGRAKLPPSLQISDRIDEPRMHPWFSDTLRLPQCDDVRSRLFYDAEAIKLQLTDYGRLPPAGRPGQYEPFH